MSLRFLRRTGGRADLTKDPIATRTLRFGFPLFLAMILHSLFNLVDIVIVGGIPDQDGIVNYGEKAITALTLASFWNMVFMVLVNGISVSSVAIISRLWGQQNYEEGNEVGRQSLALMFWISVASAALGLFSRPLIALFGAEGDVLEMGRQYLIVQMVGACTMYFLLQITALFRAAGDSLWPMALLVAANLLNLVLTILMVYGWGPIPRMNVLGAAWSTIIARGVFMVAAFGVLLVGRKNMRLRLRGFRTKLRVWGQLLWIGLPNSAQITVRLAAYMVIMRLVMEEGDLVGTAFGITAGRLDMTAIFGAAGWGAAASAMVGQNLGAGKLRRASWSGWTAAAYGAAVCGAMGLAFYGFAAPLIEFFFLVKGHAHPEVIAHGRLYLSILAPAYPFIAVGLILAQALNGAGSTKIPLLFDAIAFLVVQIPLALALRALPVGGEPLGLEGVYWAMTIASILLAGVYALWFRFGRWQGQKTG